MVKNVSEFVRQHFWYTPWSDCFASTVVMGSAKTQVPHMEHKALEGTICDHLVQAIAWTRAESSAPIAYDYFSELSVMI